MGKAVSMTSSETVLAAALSPFDRQIQCAIHAHWQAPNNIIALTTTRAIGNACAKHEDGKKNLQNIAHTLHAQLHSLQQIHSSQVVEVYPQSPTHQHGDALICHHHHQLLSIESADCVPIFLCNQAGNWIAVIHAGWRGILNNIIAHTISRYDGSSSLIAHIAPCISARHYQVNEDFYQRFKTQASQTALLPAFTPSTSPTSQQHPREKHNRQKHPRSKNDGQQSKWQFNLRQAVHIQLSNMGVKPISFASQCTYADVNLYSHRQDGTSNRQANLIMFQ